MKRFCGPFRRARRVISQRMQPPANSSTRSARYTMVRCGRPGGCCARSSNAPPHLRATCGLEGKTRSANAQPILINMSLANLTAAVNQWNADCTAGKGDTVFGRTAATMLPIATPPFYALAQWPGGPNTQGGPIRNAKAQVCDPLGDPIPRLY